MIFFFFLHVPSSMKDLCEAQVVGEIMFTVTGNDNHCFVEQCARIILSETLVRCSFFLRIHCSINCSVIFLNEATCRDS